MYDANNERVNHLFFNCKVSGSVWDKDNMWIEISMTQHYLPNHHFDHFSLLKLN